MNGSEQDIEALIKSKNLTAPRLTPDDIDAQIVGETYHHFPGTTFTVCLLTLKNGYNVCGESASVSAENFDPEIGKTVSRRNAREKIWSLQGYLLKEALSR